MKLSHLGKWRALTLRLQTRSVSRTEVQRLRCLPLTALVFKDGFLKKAHDTFSKSCFLQSISLSQWWLTGSTAAQLSPVSVLTLLQDESTAEITFYMKGADVAMSTIVQYNDWLEEEVGNLFSTLHKMSSWNLVSQRQKSSTFSTLVPLEWIMSSPFRPGMDRWPGMVIFFY